MKIAFLGLGNMGNRMARRLHEAGHALTVWNRDPARTREFAEMGTRCAGTPAAAARDADAVMLMLRDGTAVDAVLAGAHGVLAGLAPGAVVVDFSTIGPDAARSVCRQVQAAGGRFLEAPVLGSTPAAAQGTLSLLVGGDDGAIDAVSPALRCVGSRIVRTGAMGSGNLLKLAVNLMIAGTAELFAETIVFAGSQGISAAMLQDVLTASTLHSPFMDYKLPPMLARDFRPMFSAELMLKDVDLAMAGAARLGLDLPAAGIVRDRLARTVAAGDGGLDFGAVLKRLEAGRPPA